MANPDREFDARNAAVYVPNIAPTGGVAGTPIGVQSTVTGLTVTGNERNAAKEAEARSIGYSAEYIASRGGINSQGYFNDTPLSGQLSAAEQKQVRLPNGNTDTVAMAKILQDKKRVELKGQGFSDSEINTKLVTEWGDLYGGSPTITTGGYDASGNPVTGGQYDSSGKFVGSTTSGGTTTPNTTTGTGTGTGTATDTNPAYATITKLLASYGVSDIASVLNDIRKEYPEASTDDVITLLQFDDRYNAKFNARFSANAKRQEAGLTILSPADYLDMEQGYKKVLSSYGLTTFNTQTYYDKFIANDVAVTELTDRVGLAYDRVLNDPNVSNAFKKFYPSLTTTDIVTGLLDPTNQYTQLEQKVRAAEIGGAALRQGLVTSELQSIAEPSKAYSNVSTQTIGANVLGEQGVTKAGAESAYGAIAAMLPTAEKLSSIYAGQAEQYGQYQAEQEKLQGLASAARKRQELAALETAQFQGSSGVASAGLSTTYLRKSSSAGLF